MSFNFNEFLDSPAMPWAAGGALLLVIILLLLWKLAKTRNLEVQKSAQVETLSRDAAVLAERLKAKEDELVKSAEVSGQQILVITEERDRIRNALQQETTNLSELRKVSAANESTLKERINSATEKLLLLKTLP